MNCHVSAEPKKGYRPCVGILLLNASGRIFVGQRKEASETEGWQMPQGGIEKGETAENAAIREMAEEVGTDAATIIHTSEVWRSYDLPRDIAARMWKGKYLGQTQKWIGLRFTGTDADINIHTSDAEFTNWQWIEPERIISVIVPFKRDIYLSVFDEFQHLWAE